MKDKVVREMRQKCFVVVCEENHSIFFHMLDTGYMEDNGILIKNFYILIPIIFFFMNMYIVLHNLCNII